MRIQLSEHFTLRKLLKFTLPSIGMMIFTSIYGVVDGLFVSNYVGKTPFAAINLIMPILMILGALGFMIGTGGTAIVAKTMGEGKNQLANKYFTMLVISTAVGGVILSVIGQIFLPTVSRLLGAEGEMLECAVQYGRVILCTIPFFMLQNVFQSFFVTAEKPGLGLAVTVASGVTNIVLDALFVAVFGFGLVGAAVATSISQIVGGTVPVFYFFRKNNSLLRFTKTKFYPSVFVRTCTNGSSELMSNISSSVVTMLYNYQLLRFAGEDGVAAYGAIMYVGFIFASIFIGYVIGCAPIISYNYGAGNTSELKNIFKKSILLMISAGTVMMLSGILLAPALSYIFTGYDQVLYELTVKGFRIFALSFLISGINIFGSALFTALNNGAVSAAISFLRTLVFQSASIIFLPMIWEIDGIWFAAVAAELFALTVTSFFIVAKRKKYEYM